MDYGVLVYDNIFKFALFEVRTVLDCFQSFLDLDEDTKLRNLNLNSSTGFGRENTTIW